MCLRFIQAYEEEKGVHGKDVIEDEKEDDEAQGTKETRQIYPIETIGSLWGFHGHENVLGGTRIDVHLFQSE